MKKLIVIGCPGSGKTTLSEKLHELLGLPLYYLDAIWHRADRTHVERDEFDRLLGEILERDAWIIDGNYSRTLERRMVACDAVILFDLPTEICLQGARERLGKKRADMPWIDTELDPNLKREIEDFRRCNLPRIYDLLERYGEGRDVIVLHSHKEADALLSHMK